MLFFYNLIFLILHPFLNIFLKIRVAKNKEDKNRYLEKLSYLKTAPKPGVIWFHVASLGEIKSIYPIISYFQKKKINLLITSVTVSSYEYFKNNLENENTFHQYAPIDSPIIISKFLKLWQPRLTIFVESEIWPNMIIQTSKQCKLILLNCRISKKSFNKWKIIRKTFKTILEKFDVILAQGKITSNYLNHFGIKNIKLLGNIKFIQLKKNSPNIIQVNNHHNNNWAAMSIHFKEYDSIIETHFELSKIDKKITTFIIPRHLDKINEMEAIIKNHKINYQKISQNNVVNNFNGIVIVDQYGLADDIFEKVKIVLMGGSLINRGGQNPIEPLRYECKIITGKYFDNFTEVYEDLINKNLVQIINNRNELKDELSALFKKNNITEVNKSKFDLTSFSDEIYNNTVKFLDNYIR
jgi:3-deoxy-D-manno-octulosonic-acid transferase